MLDLFVATTAFALAAHVRPVFLSVGIPLLAGLFIGWHPDRRRRLLAMLIVGLTMGAGIGGWALRNALTGRYAVFSAMNDYAWLFHGAGLEARATNGDVDQIMERYRTELAREMSPDTKHLDQGRWYRAMRRKGWSAIRAQWKSIPGYAMRNLAQLMINVDHESFRQLMGYPPAPPATQGRLVAKLQRATDGVPGLRFVVGAQIVMTALLWVGVFLACVRWVEGRLSTSVRIAVAALLVAAVLGLAAGALPNAQVRFRVSLLPILWPVAALGFFAGGAPARSRSAGR